MPGDRGVPQTLRAILLSRLTHSHNFFRITSLADPYALTTVESHRYAKQGEGGTLSPRPPVFRTFFQVPYTLTLVFSHSSKNCRGGGCRQPLSVRSPAAARLRSPQATALCFHQLTNCPVCNSCVLTTLQQWGGCGGCSTFKRSDVQRSDGPIRSPSGRCRIP